MDCILARRGRPETKEADVQPRSQETLGTRLADVLPKRANKYTIRNNFWTVGSTVQGVIKWVSNNEKVKLTTTVKTRIQEHVD